MNVVLIMMAGVGSRLGKKYPKQFLEYKGKPLYFYTLEKYVKLSFIDKIVLVVHEEWNNKVKNDLKKYNINVDIVNGGSTRSHSVKEGLKYCEKFMNWSDIVLIHDITHPYVDTEATKKLICSINQTGAGTLGSFNYDTVYKIDDLNMVSHVIPRTQVISGASPEGFKFGQILEIYKNATEAELKTLTSAGAIALKYGIKFAFVQTDLLNLKITFERDWKIFQKLNGILDYK